MQIMPRRNLASAALPHFPVRRNEENYWRGSSFTESSSPMDSSRSIKRSIKRNVYYSGGRRGLGKGWPAIMRANDFIAF